jgi:hypothetical protein
VGKWGFAGGEVLWRRGSECERERQRAKREQNPSARSSAETEARKGACDQNGKFAPSVWCTGAWWALSASSFSPPLTYSHTLGLVGFASVERNVGGRRMGFLDHVRMCACLGSMMMEFDR